MSSRLTELNNILKKACKMNADFLPFDQFMHGALYTPNLGYYTATHPVGSPAQGGDFTTAPQMSALFGSTLAQAIAPVFESGIAPQLLECGAGTGKMAFDVLTRLQQLGIVIQRYFILEVSTSLRDQQRETLKNFACVVWLDALPLAFEGVVLANELLDALPVRVFETQTDPFTRSTSVLERGVAWHEGQGEPGRWEWVSRPAQAEDVATVQALLPSEAAAQPNYCMELGEQAHAWVASLAACIQRGLLLLIDYGFPRAELYHPQRTSGTLMAHHQHTASPNVLANVGAADITAHVDFTAVAQAGQAAGMNLLGYTSQARFLINAGIATAYTEAAQGLETLQAAQLSRGLQLLMSEAEMGELFKVIALGKDCPPPLGFESGDRSHRLAT